MISLGPPMDTMPPNFAKKTFSDSHKIPESFLLYNTFKLYIEAMIQDEFTQELYMTSRSFNCIHVQYIKSTSKGLYN